MQVVITGASRGIGLELARQAVTAGHEVLAVARNPANSPELARLQQQVSGRLRIIQADVRTPDAAETISAALDFAGIDVLINNAGILRDGAQREDLLESYLVNAVAPYEITCALLSRLKLSAHPRVAHLTSKMGSIADNTSGSHYAYRASKAALNMINRSLAIDHQWLTCVLVHPGWVATRMGGAHAPVTPAESAACIWRLIDGLDASRSGRFYDYLGNEIPW